MKRILWPQADIASNGDPTNPSSGSSPKPGSKTFDAFVKAMRQAISVKTMNTTTPAKTLDPKQVFWSLKRNVDDVVRFTEDRQGLGRITSAMIDTRVIELGIPAHTPAPQMEQVVRAIEYAQDKGVTLNVTTIINSVK